MTAAWWITGDARTVMADLPAGSVDLIVTSPPFLALRSYLEADDPAKVDEIGGEANPAEFIDTLLDVTEACARLLAPHGTLCVELGDTYAGSGGAGGDYGENGLRAGQPRFRARGAGPGWPLDKSLSLIPEAYRMALAYGRNPHNGRTIDPWRIRNVIRWVRPNPSPGALGDKFKPATSEMVVACKAKDRWFDLDAVRTVNHPERFNEGASPIKGRMGGTGSDADSTYRSDRSDRPWNPAGAPPLDWWQISPGGFSGAHYATFPPELCIKPIEAMCPRRVCRTCSKPSRRLTEVSGMVDRDGRQVEREVWKSGIAEGKGAHSNKTTSGTTTGWSTCGCPDTDGIRLDGYHTGPGWRPGLVLDPFGGSGTTASVASGHSRHSISIDLDARNADLARDRIGMWLQETTAYGIAALHAARYTPPKEIGSFP